MDPSAHLAARLREPWGGAALASSTTSEAVLTCLAGRFGDLVPAARARLLCAAVGTSKDVIKRTLAPLHETASTDTDDWCKVLSLLAAGDVGHPDAAALAKAFPAAGASLERLAEMAKRVEQRRQDAAAAAEHRADRTDSGRPRAAVGFHSVAGGTPSPATTPHGEGPRQAPPPHPFALPVGGRGATGSGQAGTVGRPDPPSMRPPAPPLRADRLPPAGGRPPGVPEKKYLVTKAKAKVLNTAEVGQLIGRIAATENAEKEKKAEMDRKRKAPEEPTAGSGHAAPAPPLSGPGAS